MNCPEKVKAGANPEVYEKYVEYCALSLATGVIVEVEEILPDEDMKALFAPAIRLAESLGVNILFETKGILADTKKVLDVIALFGSACVKVSWNIRETRISVTSV